MLRIHFSSDPSERTLKELPEKVLKFLRAVQLSQEIRAPLAANGYTAAEQEQGWQLLKQCSSLIDAPPPAADPIADAVEAISDWTEATFPRVEGALQRFFPEQRNFVFHNLPTGGRGFAAIVPTTTLLDRLDTLEDGAQRKGTRKADHAALKLLAERGVDAEERTRIRKLIIVAQTPPVETPSPTAGGEGAAPDKSALLALYKWHVDWASTAHAVIARRDLLVRLGLAKRQHRAAPGAGQGGSVGSGDASTPPPPTTGSTPAPPVASTPSAPTPSSPSEAMPVALLSHANEVYPRTGEPGRG